MEPAAKSRGGATKVAPEPLERALVWVGFPLVGAAAGWLLKSLAGWATSLAEQDYVMVTSPTTG